MDKSEKIAKEYYINHFGEGKSIENIGRYVKKHNHASKSRCPRPGCAGSGVQHCSICYEIYGVYVCGTNCSGHHVFDGDLRMHPFIKKDDVKHSITHWRDMEKGEYKRIFNLNDPEISNRRYFDARKSDEEVKE